MGQIAFYQTRFGTMVHHANDRVLGRALDLYGQWALDEIALIATIMTRHGAGAFLDVGSNVGSHTLAIATLFPAVEVFSYDAQRSAASLLNTAASLNDLANVTMTNVAVGSATSFVELHTNRQQAAENMGCARFEPQAGENSETVLLPQVALDDLHQKPVAFIKIDIEGAELSCLQGAKRILSDDRPIVYFENSEAVSEGPVFDFMHVRGYRTFWHINEPYDPGNFKGNERSIYGGSGEVNIVCVPPESAAMDFIARHLGETCNPLDDEVWRRTHDLNTRLKAELPHPKRDGVDRFCATLACLALNADLDADFEEQLAALVAIDPSPSFATIKSNPIYGRVEHAARPLLRDALRRRAFNDTAYVARYNDVAEAVAAGTLPSGAEHYAIAGYFEGRIAD